MEHGGVALKFLGFHKWNVFGTSGFVLCGFVDYERCLFVDGLGWSGFGSTKNEEY